MILLNKINTVNFIFDLEQIYKKYSIYRAIIIALNLLEVNLINKLLEKYDHNPLYIENTNDINLNYKLYIITLDNYNLINNIDKNNYNFIAFSYNINPRKILNI